MKLRHDEAMEWAAIARFFPGRDAKACYEKFHLECDRMRAEQGIRLGQRYIPNKVIIDRSQRELARERQHLTGLTFGDPPPGYSALDRKRVSE